MRNEHVTLLGSRKTDARLLLDRVREMLEEQPVDEDVSAADFLKHLEIVGRVIEEPGEVQRGDTRESHDQPEQTVTDHVLAATARSA
jgi:hypothetical protein